MRLQPVSAPSGQGRRDVSPNRRTAVVWECRKCRRDNHDTLLPNWWSKRNCHTCGNRVWLRLTDNGIQMQRKRPAELQRKI